MRISLSFLIFILLVCASKASSVSIEAFAKVRDRDQRWKIIEQAPDGEKEQLKAIDMHLILLDRYGGESGLKRAKETFVAKARGFEFLEEIPDDQYMLWEFYTGDDDNGRVGHEEQIKKAQRLQVEGQVIARRAKLVHSLVLNMAPSLAAMELENRAHKLHEALHGQLNDLPPGTFHAVTKAEIDAVDNEVDRIFEGMKKLPTLPPTEVQKECDEFPEAKMYSKTT